MSSLPDIAPCFSAVKKLVTNNMALAINLHQQLDAALPDLQSGSRYMKDNQSLICGLKK
jgi:hypothetical protein